MLLNMRVSSTRRTYIIFNRGKWLWNLTKGFVLCFWSLLRPDRAQSTIGHDYWSRNWPTETWRWRHSAKLECEHKTKDLAVSWTFQHKSCVLCLFLWSLPSFITSSNYVYINAFSSMPLKIQVSFTYMLSNNSLKYNPLFLNLFITNIQIHRYDTRTASNYRVRSYRPNIKKFRTLYQGPKIWNCLPVSITSLSSFPIFKNKVVKFLLK